MIVNNGLFHLAIALIGGSRHNHDWLASIVNQGQRIMRLYVRLQEELVPNEQLSFHSALIEAIRARYLDAAARAAAADAQIVRDEISWQISEGEAG